MSTQTTHPGELSLAKLLATLTTTLHPTTYVFAVIPDETRLPPFSEVEMLFREAKTEGITVITSRDYAESHGIEYAFPCRKITLDVTSSLDAVGFIAVVATRLAAAGMGVNPISGFYHDHLFVPLGREEDALEVIAELAQEKKKEAKV
ncbi:hypothetical protein D6D02_08707 [Aureobasidium pullulans]|uniref:DUF2241 domain-containing protein n=1 Tax=Aureobasidium pullulans TaxID=5580 RepID=A0A4S8XNZ6_AURPU|nr:hypothetical protein D6D23_09432 [Aureobasidium pullulans]THW40718.1 hypothetical protein D6D21_06671 [Aureobasidium pullulans]THW83490.1 hypothetical protein D6D15_09549 [Aureobasidium pullulans]THX68835.1 hypothetical protein D6D08_06190 [Aureobasidium pullulans]THX93095.1 hypothetical protein D6D03_10208 [Aureobasidium pullulans]